MIDQNFRSKLLYLIISIVICGLLILLHSVNGLNFVYSYASYISNPVKYSLISFSSTVNDFAYSISNLSKIRDENDQLKEELLHSNEEVAQLMIYKEENEKLKEQLNLQQIENYSLIESRVIGGDPRINNFLLLDKGSKAGLKEKDIVVLGKYAVGEIISLDNYSSKVKLIVAVNSNIPATTLETKARGLIKGSVNQNLILEDILPNERLVIGDTVVTTGVDSNYPYGLILGKISDVNTSDAGVMQSAVVKPLMDFRTLDTVFILVKNT